MLRLESNRLLDAADVQASSRLSVRLGPIPRDETCVSDLGRDHGRDFFDCHYLAGSEIEWSGVIVVLGGQDDSFRSILDIQKFARWSAITPDNDFTGSALFRFRAFSNESRNDVR